jgi:tetratricopeptide (TPR) repeat protein
MGATEQAHFSDAAARKWAQGFFDFEQTELVTDTPWARSYRLSRAGEAVYLKILPAQQAGVLPAVAALAAHFPLRIPNVLAHDVVQGWMISAQHGGRTLEYGAKSDDLLSLISTYASLQAQATRADQPALFEGLPRPVIADLPAQLLAFLQARDDGSGQATATVAASYFLGAADAAHYHRALQGRAPLLQRHLLAANELPLTVNHGDLRPPNAAITDDGRCVIMDWDDAIIGPAGMSLHGLYGGCTVPSVLLSGSVAAEAAATTPDGMLIHRYINTLTEAGYAERSKLLRCLSGSMCAGMLQFIVNFSKFPGQTQREEVRDTLQSRLENLLDLCDWLACADPPTALELAQDYLEHGELRRAQNLLQDYSARMPENVDVLGRLASVLRRRNKLEDAAQEYASAIELAPRDAALHAGLGGVLMEQLDLEGSRKQLHQALELDPGLHLAQENLDQIQALQNMQQCAALPGEMPRLVFSADDLAASRVRPEMLALGTSLFAQYGTMQIDNAIPADMVAQLHEAFMRRYWAYFRDDNHPDALRLGDKRYMLTVDLESPFDDPMLIGAPMVLPIIRKVLGEDCVLGAYTAVISLPGSADQRLHKDHPALFPNTEWHFKLPCFAAQIIIPLVPLTELSGTTRFYKGTHLTPTDRAEESVAQDPVVPLGSCLLNDYRCAHRGRGNRSKQVRPILTLIFNRPWFRDFKNYGKQPPLRLDEAAYERLPHDLKGLVHWRKEELAYERLRHSVLR